MKRVIRSVAAVLVLGAVVAGPARAQVGPAGTAMTPTASNSVVFGAKAGLAFPVGDFGNKGGLGFNIGGVVGFTVPNFPLGLRGDVDYNRFGKKTVSGPGGSTSASGNASIFSGTINALYGFPMEGSSFRPYAIGGLGLYRVSTSSSGTVCPGGGSCNIGQTKFGLNVGGGVEFQLSGFSTFAEARFHNVFANGTSFRYIPITFGVMFR